jgi:tetratricopeptide (TPR) repeat protein
MPLGDIFLVKPDAVVQREAAAATEGILERQRTISREVGGIRRALDGGRESIVEVGEAVRGLAGEFDALGSSISDSLDRQAELLADTTNAGFGAVVRALGRQTDEIVRRLENPRRTAALEKKRDGVRAFARRDYGRAWIDGAIADFEEATQLDRYDPEPYWYLGMLYMSSRGDDERARASFATAAAYAWPDQPDESAGALLGGAVVEAANRDYRAARLLAELATERAPHKAVAQFDVARYAAAEGDCDAAARALTRAVELDDSLIAAAAEATDFRGCQPSVDGVAATLVARELRRLEQLLPAANRGLQAARSALEPVNEVASLTSFVGEVRDAIAGLEAASVAVSQGERYRTARGHGERLESFLPRLSAHVGARLEELERKWQPGPDPGSWVPAFMRNLLFWGVVAAGVALVLGIPSAIASSLGLTAITAIVGWAVIGVFLLAVYLAWDNTGDQRARVLRHKAQLAGWAMFEQARAAWASGLAANASVSDLGEAPLIEDDGREVAVDDRS